MKKYLLGIDIGGTTVKLGLFNINGELLNKSDFIVPYELSSSLIKAVTIGSKT